MGILSIREKMPPNRFITIPPCLHSHKPSPFLSRRNISVNTCVLALIDSRISEHFLEKATLYFLINVLL